MSYPMGRHVQQFYEMALRLIGHIQERPGSAHHPFVQWAHELSGMGRGVADEVAWCSSALNALAFLAGLQRSKSAAARSWLTIGAPRLGGLRNAQVGDIVILKRGTGRGQLGAEVLDAPGHVCLFESYDIASDRFTGIGGNQQNTWSRASFPAGDVLGVRVLSSGPAT